MMNAIQNSKNTLNRTHTQDMGDSKHYTCAFTGGKWTIKFYENNIKIHEFVSYNKKSPVAVIRQVNKFYGVAI